MKNLWMFSLAAVFVISSCKDQPATEGVIAVDMAQKGPDIPASMYGVFFEEINHGGDGGLYAELVQNRSFEEKEHPAGYTVKGNKLYPSPEVNHLNGSINNSGYRWSEEDVPGWSLETKGTGARMKLTKSHPLHEATANSLEIGIPKTATEAILLNGGYWGMGITGGEKYHLRFYLRSNAYTGEVIVRLLSSAGKILDEVPVKIVTTAGWNEYRLELTPDQSDSKAKLAISFAGNGTVWVDYVSLFPENTYKNRPNGLRKDVAEFLEGLKPAFIRWPGGCIVEGITLSNRVEWKKTLGDPMTRSGEYDTWGYRNTYGFGYHEFLQYCEDVGAKGMFVCNVGIGCEYRSGDACEEGDVQFYINDVLDAIEYAIGDQGTDWGRKRMAAGHPDPFPLQYVEIGNENWGPVYNRRFDQFYQAIKEKYPQLTLISNHGLSEGAKNIAKTDMIDPHWYVAPDFFFRNAGIFDKEPRGDYQVYVGEYACNSGVGSGNMLAALSEAAFITGMERNSDLVKMASYAPLFENSNDRTWPVNLIWINSSQVIGRSSYYVQKMFAENRPGYNLHTELTPRPVRALEFIADGNVGAGTWITQAEFKDFSIKTGDGKTYRPGIRDMVKLNEEWTITDSTAWQTSDKTMTGLIWDKPVNGSYTFELKARKTGGDEGFLIYFGMSDQIKKGYLFNIGGWQNTGTALEIARGGSNSTVTEMIPQSIETGRWYNIRVVVSIEGAELWVDGIKILSYQPVSSLHQFTVSGYDEEAGELIIKVVNADETAWDTSVKINNSGRITGTGSIITLTAGSLEDENSFEEPMKIAPKVSAYEKFSGEFNYVFEPRSFTILRIRAER